ncbi:MAG: response regulator [Limisphaerales bacterium]
MELSLEVQTSPPITKSRGPILIVDDNVEFAHTLEEIISAWGYPNPVHHLLDGAMLIEYLTVCFTVGSWMQPLPALIILDINMPNYTGLDVMEWIKKAKLDHIPVVAVSGTDKTKLVIRMQKLGAKYFIPKPMGPGDLDKIKEALGVTV